MLQPGIIPDREPDIRVGIVLPEDDFTSVTIQLPAEDAYQLEFSGRIVRLKNQASLFFKISKGKVFIRHDDGEFSFENEALIYPIENSKNISPGSGVLVKNVISGRGFHWKKYIDVSLPGKIIIRQIEHKLIMTNVLPIEHYLMCVSTSEMGAACPAALIEAQTIAARSWMLANIEQKHRDLEMDVCNDDCCQRYQGTSFLTEQSIKGALATSGSVLLHDNKICDARYSKSCGGMMESFDTIWGGENLAYTQVKIDAEESPMELSSPLSDERNFKRWVKSSPVAYCSPWSVPEKDLKKYLGSVDEKGSYYRWEETLLQDDLTRNINEFHNINASAIVNMEVLERGGSGRINRLAVEYIDADGEHRILMLTSEYSVRQSLHKKFLYSSAFLITASAVKKGIPQEFVLNGAGWGHGVGLCQIGALGMSLNDKTAVEILLHYYPGSELSRIY